MTFLAIAGTCLLGLLAALALALLLIAITSPTNPEVQGDVNSRRAAIIMLSVLTVVLSIFLGLAVYHLS